MTYTTVTKIMEIAIALGRFLEMLDNYNKCLFTVPLLNRILKLLDDKVEIVPAVVSKQTRVERQCNLCKIFLCVDKVEIISFPYWNEIFSITLSILA